MTKALWWVAGAVGVAWLASHDGGTSARSPSTSYEPASWGARREDALSQLESLRPGDLAVQNARDEVDTMRRHLSRLHYENWRTVRPDLDGNAACIVVEAGEVSEEPDEE